MTFTMRGDRRGPGPGGLRSAPFNSFDYKDLAIFVGDEAFVVGYPMPTAVTPFPIWKRASIAYEPHASIDDLPKILVDTATRPGMSGSPVLLMHRGLFRERGGKIDVLGSAKAFLGVYSSGVGDLEGLQLGTVWKAIFHR